MSAIRIAPAQAGDAATLETRRRSLWPDEEPRDQAGGGVALPAWDEAGTAIGFAEAALRHDHVNGCDTRPAAFLEGLFVAPAHRGHGVARAPVATVADWARQQGARELAADAAIDNHASHAFHRAAGFEETERIVFFRRSI